MSSSPRTHKGQVAQGPPLTGKSYRASVLLWVQQSLEGQMARVLDNYPKGREPRLSPETGELGSQARGLGFLVCGMGTVLCSVGVVATPQPSKIRVSGQRLQVLFLSDGPRGSPCPTGRTGPEEPDDPSGDTGFGGL